MQRFITSATVALSFAFAVAIHAQDATIKSKTKVKGDDVKTVTYTGCLQTGTETQTYILDHVVPIGTTTRVVEGTSGAVKTTTTTYALIPGEKVEFQGHVGHKVEVTGVLISGDVKTRTKTKIEREDAKDTTMRDKSKMENAMPQLRVVSFKHLSDKCTIELVERSVRGSEFTVQGSFLVRSSWLERGCPRVFGPSDVCPHVGCAPDTWRPSGTDGPRWRSASCRPVSATTVTA